MLKRYGLHCRSFPRILIVVNVFSFVAYDKWSVTFIMTFQRWRGSEHQCFFPERAIIPLLLMKMKNSEKNPPCHRSFLSQAHACEKKEKQKSPSRVRHGKGAEHLRNRRVEFQTLSPLTLHWDTSPGQTVEPALSFRRILARCSAM